MRDVVVLGASKDRTKFGNKAVRAYVARGDRVYPVNPRETSIEGLQAYADIGLVPVRPNVVSVYVAPAVLVGLLPKIAEKGCDELWLNPGTESVEVLAEVERLKLNAIQACSLVANHWGGE